MFFILLSFFIILMGCGGDKGVRYEDAFSENIANLHTSVEKKETKIVEKVKKKPELRASIRTTKIDLDTLAYILSIVYGTNVDVLDIGDKKSSIALSLNFKDVSLDEVADRLTMGYNLYCKKTGYGYTISPPALQTKIFNIDYTSFKRKGVSSIAISNSGLSGQSKSGLHIDTSMEDNFWEQISDAVKLIVYDDTDLVNKNLSLTPKMSNSSVAVDTQSGALIVRALPRALQMIQKFVDKLQAVTTKQVFIEAKILEIKLEKSYRNGIDWDAIKNTFPGVESDEKAVDKQGAQTDDWNAIKFDGSMIHKSISGLNLIVNALSKQGKLSVLSSPTLSVSHNQIAMIKVGRDKFVVDNVEGIQVQSSKDDKDGNSSNQLSGFKLRPLFHGIALETGVNVLNDEEVMMHLHPIISRVDDSEHKTITLGNSKSEVPVAYVDIREVDTIVKARSNDIVVLAGLSKNVMKEGTSSDGLFGVDFLHKSKGLNNRTELVILIRPVIGGRDIRGNLKSFQKMLK
ncbi:MAG: hypothetical protein AAFO15_02475 [Pseudomonadota bacterium]